ncbi:MAG: type II toxin-antitoxin system death-on-curing family toxin [Candidatus Onthovivens sp.]|nr:type II toxin-antitoxin system death-on-curing family toxin [Candidatus Onthovivens sp.]
MIKLSKQQVISMQKKLILVTGGLEGIRDENLLDSALETPFQTFDNKDLYETLQAKAARLAFGLVQNHPFIDGNKRIGAHSMLVFLALNNIFFIIHKKNWHLSF